MLLMFLVLFFEGSPKRNVRNTRFWKWKLKFLSSSVLLFCIKRWKNLTICGINRMFWVCFFHDLCNSARLNSLFLHYCTVFFFFLRHAVWYRCYCCYCCSCCVTTASAATVALAATDGTVANPSASSAAYAATGASAANNTATATVAGEYTLRQAAEHYLRSIYPVFLFV